MGFAGPLHESEIPDDLRQYFEEIPEQERPTVPAVVCDPFSGLFTTCQVAVELGRSAIGIELNPAYVALGRQRCAVTPGLAL